MQTIVEQQFDIHQTKTEKHVHQTDSYFQKHVSSKRKRAGRHVISLNEHRAIKNTKHNYDSELQTIVEQQFDIHHTTTRKHVHQTDSYFQKHCSSKHRRTGRHVLSSNEHRAIKNTKHNFDSE